MNMAENLKPQAGPGSVPGTALVVTQDAASLPYRYLSRVIEREFPRNQGGVALAFCAPDADRIGTNVILMLAYCLHQELDTSVLVIDARTQDLGGGISERLGLQALPGLRDLLRAGPADLARYTRPAGSPGIDVLPQGQDHGDPASILHHALPGLLAHAKGHYGYVLVQVNPVSSDTRSMVTATHADAVVLLALENHTLMSTLNASEQLLRGNGASEIRAVVVAG